MWHISKNNLMNADTDFKKCNARTITLTKFM